jgi:uncharacterized protein YhfF
MALRNAQGQRGKYLTLELSSTRNPLEDMRAIVITGCEFSAAQELLVLATGEGNSSIREWCGQKNAEDSGAQPDTKRR